MTECQRCPAEIGKAANKLMGLYPAHPMVPGSTAVPNTHIVFWETPRAESKGMAKAIVENHKAHPNDRHLVMVTRRQFGYWLRQDIHELSPELNIDLSFSESLLETWAVREAFLFFCLCVDPDAPTWRAWIGYQDSKDGKKFNAPERNSDAYLRFLTKTADRITAHDVLALSTEPRGMRRGSGGAVLWDRATRYVTLRSQMDLPPDDPEASIRMLFEPSLWIGNDYVEPETARLDLDLVIDKATDLFKEAHEQHGLEDASKLLKRVARRLRYQIATREPFVSGAKADIQVATLWGAKGVTADHVYVIGLSAEMLPGQRRDEYPGTEQEYFEEQRRLFYVSMTRSKRTLVLSRAMRINRSQALRIGIQTVPGPGYMADLAMCPFLHDIINFLPLGERGELWPGP